MPVESIHHLMALAYVFVWVLIGHITTGRRGTAEREAVQQSMP